MIDNIYRNYYFAIMFFHKLLQTFRAGPLRCLRYFSPACIFLLLFFMGCGIAEQNKKDGECLARYHSKVYTAENNKIREQLYFKCLDIVLKNTGPKKTHYNDWNEVVITSMQRCSMEADEMAYDNYEKQNQLRYSIFNCD